MSLSLFVYEGAPEGDNDEIIIGNSRQRVEKDYFFKNSGRYIENYDVTEVKGPIQIRSKVFILRLRDI